MLNRIVILLIALPSFVSSVSYAADVPITPGSVQDSLMQNKPAVENAPAQLLFQAQPEAVQHDRKARRFRVNAFEFIGNTVFEKQTLRRVVERFLDLELNLYDLNKAADALTLFYHERGYTLARAVVPAQKVENGIVKMELVEGRFGKVSISGNNRYSTNFLSAWTETLQPDVLVISPLLENNLLLLDELPGLDARVVLEPGSDFGTTDAEIKVTEKLVDASMSLSNYGRAETGQDKFDASLTINAPFGWGDQLALSGSVTSHRMVRYGRVNYSFPLNTVGTRLSLAHSKSVYEVGGALAALNVTGELEASEVSVIHPIKRTREERRTFILNAKRNKLMQSALGTPIAQNVIKVMTATYLINRVHPDSSTSNASFGFSSNFKKGSNDPNGVFLRTEIDVNYLSPLSKQWDLYLHGNLVHSREHLPDTEKFSLGGPSSVRAFRPSELRGDSGYLFSIDVRRPFTVADKIALFRVTADAGQAIYKQFGFRDGRDNLRSIGLGLNFYPYKGTSIVIDLARSIGSSHSANDGRENHRLWAAFNANF